MRRNAIRKRTSYVSIETLSELRRQALILTFKNQATILACLPPRPFVNVNATSSTFLTLYLLVMEVLVVEWRSEDDSNEINVIMLSLW